MTTNVDLQSITDAWGTWKAGSLGTGLNFTASTNFGANSNLAS